MNEMFSTPFLRTLGLYGSLEQYSPDDINKAWKRAMLQAHPDKGGSKEQVHELTRAREHLLKMLNAEGDIPWEDIISCDECFGKHPNNCCCTCKTCREDKAKRDFDAFLDEHPEFMGIVQEMRARDRARAQYAEQRAGDLYSAAVLADARQTKAEKERDKAEKAREEAEQRAEAATAAMTPEASHKLASVQYYSKIRRELHLGKTTAGTKLTPQMVQERFDKLEERNATLAPRYQAAAAEELRGLREKWKEDLTAVASEINQHTTNEVAGVHSRLERIEARLEGRLAPRRPDQSASQRKREIDEILPGLRQERKELVAEERAEKAARKQK